MFSVLEQKEGARCLKKVIDEILEFATIYIFLYDKRYKTFDQVVEDHNLLLFQYIIKNIMCNHKDPAYSQAIIRNT